MKRLSMDIKIADKLEIKLLDATIKGDFRWIDKEAYKKTGKIRFQEDF